MMDKPDITQEELAKLLDVNKRTIIRNFKTLLDEKYIERVGANKNGYWKINNLEKVKNNKDYFDETKLGG